MQECVGRELGFIRLRLQPEILHPLEDGFKAAIHLTTSESGSKTVMDAFSECDMITHVVTHDVESQSIFELLIVLIGRSEARKTNRVLGNLHTMKLDLSRRSSKHVR